MRRAFTLVELLVAVVILSVGVLALASTAGLVAAHVGDGGRLTGAAHAARSTLDSLMTRRCPELVSGSTARSGLVVRWTVSRDSLVARVELGVGAALRARSHHRVYRAVVSCVAP